MKTLYSLSIHYGLDYKLIAAENNIESPYAISVGQKILIKKVKPVASRLSSEVELPVDNKGCYVMFSISGANFGLDSIVIAPATRRVLDEVAATLKANLGIRVQVEGHTDSLGDADYNQKLSERRADSVKQYLISQGIADERLQALGFW